jgi:hypothetical protein
MADKYDGVVEAVRYAPDGRIAMVRVYQRRGPTWSDRLLLDRDAFIQLLKSKKRFYIGKRVEFMAGTFQVDRPVRLVGQAGHERLVTVDGGTGGADGSVERDQLEGAPLF